MYKSCLWFHGTPSIHNSTGSCFSCGSFFCTIICFVLAMSTWLSSSVFVLFCLDHTFSISIRLKNSSIYLVFRSQTFVLSHWTVSIGRHWRKCSNPTQVMKAWPTMYSVGCALSLKRNESMTMHTKVGNFMAQHCYPNRDVKYHFSFNVNTDDLCKAPKKWNHAKTLSWSKNLCDLSVLLPK